MSWNSRTRHHPQRGPSTAPPLSPQGSPSHFRVHSIHLKFSHVNTRTCASQFNILTIWIQFYQSLALIPPCRIVDLTSQKESSCSFVYKTIFIQGLMIIKWPKLSNEHTLTDFCSRVVNPIVGEVRGGRALPVTTMDFCGWPRVSWFGWWCAKEQKRMGWIWIDLGGHTLKCNICFFSCNCWLHCLVPF